MSDESRPGPAATPVAPPSLGETIREEVAPFRDMTPVGDATVEHRTWYYAADPPLERGPPASDLGPAAPRWIELRRN